MNLRFDRAGDAEWETIWPLWHQVVAAGDTDAFDPDTSPATARAVGRTRAEHGL